VIERAPYAARALLLAACGALAASCGDAADGSGDGPATAPTPQDASAPERAPDVLLISLDTLRADALSCYGNPNATTPVMDALAARGVRFANGYAPSPHTAPSHVSLFTGLLPLAHGVGNASTSSASVANLNAGVETLTERMKAGGWRVVMVGGRGQLRPAMGISRGADFHHFRSTTFLDGLEVFDEVVGTEDADEPLFAFFHTYEPHAPYLPPREYAGERFRGRYTDPDYDGRFAARYDALIDDPNAGEKAGLFLETKAPLTDDDRAFLRGLYDENVAWTDHLLGELFDTWSRYRDLDRTLVVLVSDHGDQLGERSNQLGHRAGVWHELAHVPLIVAGPGIEPAVVEAPVGIAAVPATLLALLGLPELAEARPSFDALLTAPDAEWTLPAYTQDAFGRQQSYAGTLRGLQTVVLERENGNEVRHFDLAADPRGLTGFDAVPERAIELRQRIGGRLMKDRSIALANPADERPLVDDGDLRKRLAELGYAEGEDEE